MKKIYESKNYIQPVVFQDILNELPEGFDASHVKVIPIFAVYGEFGLSEMVGFKFVVYDEK